MGSSMQVAGTLVPVPVSLDIRPRLVVDIAVDVPAAYTSTDYRSGNDHQIARKHQTRRCKDPEIHSRRGEFRLVPPR